ncbi:unnamed protein product [Somion occarium]|uniref:Uncharacterized protein n=1 Tax=Somion occarium TaxID=3059160 RepID=A0ABP1CJM4_9APHY
MGSLCSKPGTHSGEHVQLHDGHPPTGNGTRHTVGASGGERPDPRAAAAQAAEERLKAAQARGTNPANPKKGRLAAQLEASKSAPRVPEPPQPERLVWD